jgi:hypothetical protein
MLFSLCIFGLCLFWAKKTHRHSIILNFIMQSYNTMWDYQLVIIIYMVHGNDLFLWFVFESGVLFHPIIKGKKEEMNNSCWAEIKPNDNFHPNSLQPFQHKCFRVCSSAHTVNFLCIVVADTNQASGASRWPGGSRLTLRCCKVKIWLLTSSQNICRFDFLY